MRTFTNVQCTDYLLGTLDHVSAIVADNLNFSKGTSMQLEWKNAGNILGKI